eukprot:142886-Chlamydomonas_euryale.AAC.1
MGRIPCTVSERTPSHAHLLIGCIPCTASEWPHWDPVLASRLWIRHPWVWCNAPSPPSRESSHTGRLKKVDWGARSPFGHAMVDGAPPVGCFRLPTVPLSTLRKLSTPQRHFKAQLDSFESKTLKTCEMQVGQ